MKIAGFIAAFLLAIVVQAQQAVQFPRIGFLGFSSLERDKSRLDALKKGLGDLGYFEGRNILIVQRYANGDAEALSRLAAELVGLKVDLLVTEGTPAARAAMIATRTIPIVMGNAGDPVATGLVASLARPGGNITGLSDFSSDIAAKRLELLKELAPSALHFAVLFNPTNPSNPLEVARLREAAALIGVRLSTFEISGADDIERAYQTMRASPRGAVILAGDAIFGLHRERIIALAANSRLPTMYPARQHVDAGGLMSYGTNFDNLYRRSAIFVDKILKGARPADLPVEQPTRFELVINRKTAKALGLTIPQSVLLRTDEFIE